MRFGAPVPVALYVFPCGHLGAADLANHVGRGAEQASFSDLGPERASLARRCVRAATIDAPQRARARRRRDVDVLVRFVLRAPAFRASGGAETVLGPMVSPTARALYDLWAGDARPNADADREQSDGGGRGARTVRRVKRDEERAGGEVVAAMPHRSPEDVDGCSSEGFGHFGACLLQSHRLEALGCLEEVWGVWDREFDPRVGRLNSCIYCSFELGGKGGLIRPSSRE